MKALILAAGLGTRLAPLTNDRPKSLVTVNGKAILEKQIENLLLNDVTDITIVSGYQADALEKAIHGKWPQIHIICNDVYENTNNMYSAFLSEPYLNHMDFLMMNADVFFDSSVISSLLSFSAPNAIVTDIGTYYEESMKVRVSNKKIIEISKAITKEDAFGSSIDVYKFSADGGAAFFSKCSAYIDEKKELKKWSEIALNEALADVDFYPCPLNGRWFEIDTKEDLQIAESIFKE